MNQTEKSNKTKGLKAIFGKTSHGLSSIVIALFIMVIIQCVVIGLNEGSFASVLPTLAQSWMNILRNNTYTGLMALGMCFVIVSGGIDLSVGSMMCATGAALMYLVEPSTGLLQSIGITGIPAYIIAVIASILIGLVFGELNGLLVTLGKIPPFIATLGTMKIFRSVTQQVTQHFNPTVPKGFKNIASVKIGGQVVLPIIYWVVIAAVMYLLFKKTAFGKKVIAVGSNERAARYSGINVNKVKRRVYALSGVMCGIAAVIYVARLGSMDFANAGNGFEMEALAAVVVGGTAMSGGKGNLAGAFLGMLIIAVMNNILNTLGVPTFLCDAVRGAIIILAVLVQRKNNADE